MTENEIKNKFFEHLKNNETQECKDIINSYPHLLRTQLEIEDEQIELFYDDAASLSFKFGNKELIEFILDNHFSSLQSIENGKYQNSQLISSIINSEDNETLRLVLEHKNKNSIDWNHISYNSSPLIEAINASIDIDLIKKIFDLNVNPLQATPNGENAFIACAKNGNIDIFNVLNTNDAINSPDLDIDLIINKSIQYNNAPVFDAIFKQGTKGLDYLFQLAVEFKTTRILEAIILENSFIPGAQQLNDLTEIICYTYESKEDTESAIFLMNFLCTVKVKFEKFLNVDNQNIWNLAIDNNNNVLIDKLLSIPEIINQRDVDGNSPLMYALERRMHIIADKILECKPNVNLKNNKGDSALIFATKNNMSQLVDPLIKLNAFTYEKNKKEETPLFWAIKHANFPMVAKLLWAGAPIATNSLTVQNKLITGQISLTGEFHMDNRNMDEMLLNNFKALVHIGFNLNAKSEQNLTFPMHFVVNNHIRNFASILECYFDPNQQKESDGNSILMEAIKQSNPLYVNLLVQRFGTEIDASLENDKGQNAVELAIEKQNVAALWHILNKTDNVTEKMIKQSLPLLLESLDYSSEELYNLANDFNIPLNTIKTLSGEDIWFTAIRRKSIEDLKFLIVNFEEGPNFLHQNNNTEKIEDIIDSIKDTNFKNDVNHILSPRKKLQIK